MTLFGVELIIGCKNRIDLVKDMTIFLSEPVQSFFIFKVEKILKRSLDSIPSPPLSVKIQIMCGKVCLRCKGKTLLGVVNKHLKSKSLSTSPSYVLPYYRTKFEFSLKVKLMASNLGYLLKSFLLYKIYVIRTYEGNF